MSESLSTGLVQQFIERTGQLYSLPAVAMEVLRLTDQETVDAKQLKDCIERDPALTTRILRVANSSLFGPSRPITDLAQALALLGTRPLKMLVLGFSLPKELFSGIAGEVLARYWRHTLIKAVAARELAERLWRMPGDDGFTAALVQDVGQLALIQQLGESYVQFLNRVHVRGGSLLDQEIDTLGFDHVVLSARLLARWGLPANMVSAISIRPDEQQIAGLELNEQPLPQMLHLAELLARLIEQPYGSALHDLLAIGGRYRGLTFEQLQPIVAKIQQQVAELADVLSWELPAGTDYIDLLMTAQRRLADESEVAAVQLASAEPEAELLAVARRMQSDLAAACGRKGVAATTAASAPVSPPSSPRTNESALQTARTTVLRAGQAVADASLPGLVSAAVGRCRSSRCPISLALVQIDNSRNLLLQLGPEAWAGVVHQVRDRLAEWTSQRAPVSLIGECDYAVVWEDCSRSDAVQCMRRALADAKAWWESQGNLSELTLSAGLATLEFPPRNFPPRQLIDAAQRCLDGAQLSGGDTLKSIVF